MKTKVTVLDVESGTLSQVKMKFKDGKKKFKLISGKGWTKPGKTRMKLTKNCALGDEELVIVENDKFIIEMDFLTLCDLKEILDSVDKLGNNWFGETKVLK